MEPYFQSGGATIYNGDCMEVMQNLPSGSIDLICTDPPYGIDYRPKRHARIANDTAPFVWWLYHARRLLGDEGALICFCRWDVAEAFRGAIELAGLTVKSQVVWDRIVHGMGDLKGAAAPRHDTIWFAVKGKYQFAGKRPTSVLPFQRLPGAKLKHPNEKPVALMESIVNSYSRESATVLDCFMGSGSTGVACRTLNRKFIGIELDANYCELASHRIQQAGNVTTSDRISLA